MRTGMTSSWRPRRPLASIVLADDLLDEILADLRAFLDAGAWYTTRGVPHRRGYLLHGPPGNGKTTLVAAVAGELGLSVAVLSLSNKVLTDDSLRNQVNALPPGAVLLIEDIDCAFAEKRGAGEATGVTMSGLLNALDGVSSREGRVLFLTTNHPERLDPALVRPGRVDRSFHLGNTTPDQARRLFEWFYSGGRDGPRGRVLGRRLRRADPRGPGLHGGDPGTPAPVPDRSPDRRPGARRPPDRTRERTRTRGVCIGLGGRGVSRSVSEYPR